MTILAPITRGDRRKIYITALVDAAGDATTFGGDDIVRWTAKHYHSDSDLDAVFAKSSTAEIDDDEFDFEVTKHDPAIEVDIDGETVLVAATVLITPADFDGIEPDDAELVWDAQCAIEGDAAHVVTVDGGTVPLAADVSLTAP
jgi:hypothetical protein